MKNLKEYIVEVYGNGWTSSVSNNLGGYNQKPIKQEIESWCNEMKIRNYTINSKGEIDVNGDVYLRDKDFKELPYKFGKVDRDFNINFNINLISLKNCPDEVGGIFNCVHCKNLITLEGAPQKVGDIFKCDDCTSLTSLEGAPQKVGKSFNCSGCTNLTSLNGPKEVGGNFKCVMCNNLKSLEKAPVSVGNLFDCSYCANLTSLNGCPKIVGGGFWCYECKKQFTEKEIRSLCKVKGEIKTFNYER